MFSLFKPAFPLHQAASHSDIKAFKKHLSLNALKETDILGRTPIHYAALSANVEMLELIKESFGEKELTSCLTATSNRGLSVEDYVLNRATEASLEKRLEFIKTVGKYVGLSHFGTSKAAELNTQDIQDAMAPSMAPYAIKAELDKDMATHTIIEPAVIEVECCGKTASESDT